MYFILNIDNFEPLAPIGMVLNCFYILNLKEILNNLLLKIFINDYDGYILFLEI